MPQRLLLILPTWLGDVCMATPTLRALRARFPDAHLTAALKPGVAPLADALPGIDHAVSGPFNASPTWLRDAGPFDHAIVLPNSFRSALLAYRTGTPKRTGFPGNGRSLLLNDRAPRPTATDPTLPVPTVHHYLALAQHLGANTTNATLSLNITTDQQATATQLLTPLPPLPESERSEASGPHSSLTTHHSTLPPLILLNPGAVRPSKRWPTESFAALADQLHTQGYRTAVTGSPAEADLLDAVVDQASAPVANLQRTGLKLATLPAVLAQAALLITNDTGTRHVAAAVGTPTVTLFGPTPPEWTTLTNHRERTLLAGGPRQPNEPIVSAKHEVPGREMHRIQVDDALSAALDLLNETDPRQP